MKKAGWDARRDHGFEQPVLAARGRSGWSFLLFARKSLLQTAIDLRQFPKCCKQQHRDYKKQKLDEHSCSPFRELVGNGDGRY
jgi:hypothetical protein